MSEDSLFSLASLCLKKPSVVKHQTPILLLSHMRANTSLIGHILGSNKDINGYYEMHIGYYSAKSHYRQKLRFFSEHLTEQVKPFIFDKVLHNEHEVTEDYIEAMRPKILITVREPATSIASIMKLYSKIDSTHEFATETGATDYYIKRLKWLAEFADRHSNYYFYKAEDLLNNTEECLIQLSSFLGLEEQLSSEFEVKHLSNKAKVGDSSGMLLKGKVVKKQSNATHHAPDGKVHQKAEDIYTLLLDSLC
jgi:hypothetical protein